MFSKSIIFWFAISLLSIWSCSRENSAPNASISIYPSAGMTSTIFDIDASQSYDDESIPQLLEFRWDYNGDGQWDTSFNKGAITAYQYKNTGDYTIIVEVRDPYGLCATKESKIVVTSKGYFIDERDGMEYSMVRFSDTWWMGENLNFGKEISSDQEQSNNGEVEKYIYPYPESSFLSGGLYQWDEAMNYTKKERSKGICPSGWFLPSDQDWKKLLQHFEDPVGIRIPDYSIQNSKFIPDQIVHHDNYQADGAIWKLLKTTGRAGFDLVMVGYRDPDGMFGFADYHFVGETATFWTSSKNNNYPIRSRFYKNGGNGEVFRFWDNPKYGFSIRCIKMDE